MIDLNNSATITKAKECKKIGQPMQSVLMTVAIFVLAQLVLLIPYKLLSIAIIAYAKYKPENLEFIFSPSFPQILSLFMTFMTILLCILYVKFIDGRKLCTIGFSKSHCIIKYITGLIVGLAMFSAVMIILIAAGVVKLSINTSVSPIILVMFLMGYMVQGASEEVLCRGYLFTSIAAKKDVVYGAVISSVFFALLHLMNPGFTLLAFINITLVGMLFALYFIRTDNILGACAIHSMWNFAQGNIYGISVSGTSLCPSIFTSTLTQNSLISGGSFGAEGGLACTAVLMASILLILFIPNKTSYTIKTPTSNNIR